MPPFIKAELDFSRGLKRGRSKLGKIFNGTGIHRRQYSKKRAFDYLANF